MYVNNLSSIRFMVVKCTGVVTLMYQLPPYPTKGKWSVRVEALSQTHEQRFYVERYYITFFEVLFY